jgi:copper(I)-binding protein
MAFPRSTRRALLAAGLLSLGIAPAFAHDARAGDLAVLEPWSRAAGANGTGAGYLTIRNAGSQPDRLLSATSPIARKVEMHSHIRDGEVMRMREVADIPVPAGQTVELRPGGLHIMLIGLTEPLRQGTEVPLTLQFEQAGRLEVMLHVQAAGARGPGHHH